MIRRVQHLAEQWSAAECAFAVRTRDGDAVEPEPAVAAEFFGDRLALARAYVAALADAGVVRGLIGPRERVPAVDATPAQFGGDGARWCRSGPGWSTSAPARDCPASPWRSPGRTCRVDLVEPLERRTTLPVGGGRALGLTECRVVRGRAEEVVELGRRRRCGDLPGRRAARQAGRLVGPARPDRWAAARAQGGVGGRGGRIVTRPFCGPPRAVDVEVVTVGRGHRRPGDLRGRGTVTGRRWPGCDAPAGRRKGRPGRLRRRVGRRSDVAWVRCSASEVRAARLMQSALSSTPA